MFKNFLEKFAEENSKNKEEIIFKIKENFEEYFKIENYSQIIKKR
jgi:hypothetical protein